MFIRVGGWQADAGPGVIQLAIVDDCSADLDGAPIWWRAGAALVVSLAIQVGVNYANDYSDGVRGTDDQRVGPMRLVGSGAASPRAVKRAAMLAFGLAALIGLLLAAAAGWWLIALGAASILAAWFYTGGPKPYGYLGLGEIFVFAFFGLVATAGTTYVQDERFTTLAIAASVPVGLLAVALLMTNNLRDLPKDANAGKRTLAVRMGDRPTRLLYTAVVVAVFLFLPYLALLRPWVLLGLLGSPFAVAPNRTVLRGATGPDLIPVLSATGRLQLVVGLLLTVGLALSA